MGRTTSILGLFVACVITTTSVFGQTRSDARESTAVVSGNEEATPSAQAPSEALESDDAPDVAQLSRLHLAMRKNLKLTSAQETAIRGLFRMQIASLRGKGGSGSLSGAGEADSSELAKLRERLNEAREQGDDRSLRRLRKEFREKMSARMAPRPVSIVDFIAKVSAELTNDQRVEFRKLASAMRAERFGERSDFGDLRKFWRVVSSPAIGLSSEQRRTAIGIMRVGIADLAQARKERADGGPIVSALRRDVLEELTAAQRAKVEIALELRPTRSPDAAEPVADVRLVMDKVTTTDAKAEPEVKTESKPDAAPAEEEQVLRKTEEQAPVVVSTEPVAKPQAAPAATEEKPQSASGESGEKPEAKAPDNPKPAPAEQKESGAKEKSDQDEASNEGDGDG